MSGQFLDTNEGRESLFGKSLADQEDASYNTNKNNKRNQDGSFNN